MKKEAVMLKSDQFWIGFIELQMKMYNLLYIYSSNKNGNLSFSKCPFFHSHLPNFHIMLMYANIIHNLSTTSHKKMINHKPLAKSFAIIVQYYAHFFSSWTIYFGIGFLCFFLSLSFK